MGEDSIVQKVLDAGWALLFTAFAFVGLFLATGTLSQFELPEEVTIPWYVLLYSFLGSVAYVLSAIVGRQERSDYKKLKIKEKELKEKQQKVEKGTLTSKEMSLNLIDLEKLKKHQIGLLNIHLKLARVPFGMLMAAAFFLVARQVVSESLVDVFGDRLLAGCAFLVAFFPKVIMKGFHGLADRLLGGAGASGSGESEEESS